jgi:hypothetical protein
MGEKRSEYTISWGGLKEIDHLESLGIDGR